MAEIRRCPECEAELATNAPEGLCPKCLLAAGLEETGAEQAPAADAVTIVPSDDEWSSSPLGTKVRYFGDYELLEEIARGGMGVVFKARQVNLNRIVALKMIKSGELAGQEEIHRFRTEAEAAANLQHANIVTIHEVGEHEAQHYFSMDYVDGSSLAEIVRRQPLSVKKAAEYLKTIAEAIHYAHSQGTLHRDLKPSNILIDQSDQPRITDFGVAKRIEDDSKLTASGAVLGTPSYMPPEQAAAERGLIGPASDVYSLGAMLYELLTGRPPFQAKTPLDTLMQVLEQEPVSPRTLNTNIPPDLATICLKCLEKRPDKRYRTAQELAEDLGRFLIQEPILAHPAGSFRKLWSRVKRHPWIITAVVSLLMGGVVCYAYYLRVDNSFLRWSASNTGYVKKPGPLTSEFKNVHGQALIVWLGLLCAQHLFKSHALKCKFDGESVSPDLLAINGVGGAIGIAFGIYVAMKSIDAHVWEDHNLLAGWISVYLCCYIGCIILVRVLREYESSAFCTATETATASNETLEDIRNLFMSDAPVVPLARGITIYRKSTGAKLLEATIAVEKLQTELHLTYPEKVAQVPDRSTGYFKGLWTWLLILFVPVCFLVSLAPTFGGFQLLAGVAGFGAGAGATVTYRKNNHQFTRGLLAFVLLLLAGIGGFSVMYPVLTVLTVSLIGVVAGVGYGFGVPKSWFTNHVQARKAYYGKARFVKLVLNAGLTGLVMGLATATGTTLWGPSLSTRSEYVGFWLLMPVCFAVVLAVLAAVALSVVPFFLWLSSSNEDRLEGLNFPDKNGKSPPQT